MTLMKYCSTCRKRLLQIRQCDCNAEEFEALCEFKNISAGVAPERCSFRNKNFCCHLIKFICPCCSNKKPLLTGNLNIFAEPGAAAATRFDS